MIDYNDPAYVAWDKALEAIQAAHHRYRAKLDQPERAEALLRLQEARELYDELLAQLP